MGNLPTAINMIVFSHQQWRHNLLYQIFRGIANTMEVLNHCLNFYVFCMASSEYSRAFLYTCTAIRGKCCASHAMRRCSSLDDSPMRRQQSSAAVANAGRGNDSLVVIENRHAIDMRRTAAVPCGNDVPTVKTERRRSLNILTNSTNSTAAIVVTMEVDSGRGGGEHSANSDSLVYL